MKAFAALLFLCGSASALELRGIKKPVDYSNEAASISKMMEAVRQKTEGPSATPKKALVVKEAVTKTGTDGEMFPGLDDELMSRADKIADDMRQQDAEKRAPKKQMSALAAKKDDHDSKKDRAARFFATHGMKDIGSILGDTLSATQEKTVVEQASKDREVLARSVGKTIEIPTLSSSSPTAPSSSMDDIPLDDDEQEQQNRWKAVDALRKRHMMR